ncbi:unnamed protein product [Symbiodinium sp. CCMP2592]|nr:unnamed protein product [Symbiodinium sp. CCMP2592]
MASEWLHVGDQALSASDLNRCQSREGMQEYAKGWLQRQAMQGKPVVKSTAAGAVTCYIYCRMHANCKQVTRLNVDHGNGNHGLQIHVKGEHENNPRLIRGLPVGQVLEARRRAHQPPMQALADILADPPAAAGDGQAAAPLYGVLRNVRRGFLRRNVDPARRGNTNAEVGWREWLHEAAGRPVQDVLQFQVHVVGQQDRAPLCVLTADAFLQAAKLVLRDHSFADAYGVCDASFKINKANWGLFMLGLSAKHYTDRQVWSSQLLPLGFAWVPKEDGHGFKSVLQRLKEWYGARDVDLNFAMQEVHFDDSDSGRLAVAAVFPQVMFKRCLRHQLQAVRRRSGDLKKFVASMVALTAHTVNRYLFDLLWQSVLTRLASADAEWEAYVKSHVLVRTDDNLWSAEWHCVPRLTSWKPAERGEHPTSRPGFTTATLGQSVESWWSAIKRVLPVNVQSMNLVNATASLEGAVRATWLGKGWVQDGSVPASNDRFQTVPGSFSTKLFTEGSVVRCVFKDGELQRIPPVPAFIKHRSYLRKDFPILAFDNVCRAYLVPGAEPDLPLEPAMFEAMLGLIRAQSVGDAQEALKALGCWLTAENRVSIAAYRYTFQQLSVVTVLRNDDFAPGSYRCTCTCHARDAQCVHEGFCRVLDGDPALPTNDLRCFTKKKTVVPLLPTTRPGPMARMPSASAWVTRDSVEAAVRQNARGRAAASVLDTPPKNPGSKGAGRRASRTSIVGNAESNEDREAILCKIAKSLQERKFADMRSALVALETLEVSADDLKRHNLGKLVKQVAENTELCVLLRMKAQRIKTVWVHCVREGRS